MTSVATSTGTAERRRLGTFGGVFTPSILTIVGVILYLRFGWVVGNVGLPGTLLIVTIATSITMLTGLSIAQIATDKEVRTGGAYYMVSRSLGAEIGGAIGVPLFLAQALSVALYVLGFAESVNATFPEVPARPLAIATTLVVTVIAIVSARTAIRVQYVIMAAIALSLVSFFIGSGETLESPSYVGPPQITPEPIVTEPFWAVFAVFFPAVTGIMAGVNMSGDLATPRRSIPRGTFWAIGVGYALYMVIPSFLDHRADQETLIADPLVMEKMAFWGPAILIGVWGAALSSALGSILGAPRILQALARDGVLPRSARRLGRGSGQDDAPRIGTVLSMAIAVVVVAIGDLDAVAPVLTMFFLVTYAVVNLISAAERYLGSPSFRPTFTVHWSLSLLGGIGCVLVMLLIDPVASIAAFTTVGLIWFLLNRRRSRARFGDVRQGMWLALIRWSVAKLHPATDPRSWRPNVLVFAGSPTRRWYLIDLAAALTSARGMLTVATVLPDVTPTSRKRQLAGTVREYLAERQVDALVRVVGAPTPYVGARVLVEGYGLGPLVPNTVVLGDGAGPDHPDRHAFVDTIARLHEAGRHVVVVRAPNDTTYGARRRIDLWLRSMRDNGALMITLANALQASRRWGRAKVTVRMVVTNEAAARTAGENLRGLLDTARVAAQVDVVVDERPIAVVINERAAGADLTMIGLPDPCTGPHDFADRCTSTLDRVDVPGPALFVLASADVDMTAVLT